MLGTGLSGCSRQAYTSSLRLARVCGHLRRPLLLPAARRARDPAAQASCTLRWPEGVTSPSLLLPTMQGERGGVGWAAERAHPQGGISPRVPISTTPGPDVQSTPHGGRGDPKSGPLLCGLSLCEWRLRGAPSPQPRAGGGRLLQTLRGDGAVLLVILEAAWVPLPCLPACPVSRPRGAVTAKGNETARPQRRRPEPAASSGLGEKHDFQKSSLSSEKTRLPS